MNNNENKTVTVEEFKKMMDFLEERGKIEKESAIEKTLDNIAFRTQLQYDNYKEFKNAECDENNYECLKAILRMTFNALKQCGVDLKD